MRPRSQAGRRLRFLLSANCVVLTVKYEPLRQTCSVSADLPKSSNCLFSHFGLRRRRRRRGTDVVFAPAGLLPSPLRSACPPRGFGRRTQRRRGSSSQPAGSPMRPSKAHIAAPVLTFWPPLPTTNNSTCSSPTPGRCARAPHFGLTPRRPAALRSSTTRLRTSRQGRAGRAKAQRANRA